MKIIIEIKNPSEIVNKAINILLKNKNRSIFQLTEEEQNILFVANKLVDLSVEGNQNDIIS